MIHLYSSFIVLFSDDNSSHKQELMKKFSLDFKGGNILILCFDKKLVNEISCLKTGWANFDNLNLLKVIRVKNKLCHYQVKGELSSKISTSKILKYLLIHSANNPEVSISILEHFKGITINNKIRFSSDKVLKYIGKIKTIYSFNCDIPFQSNKITLSTCKEPERFSFIPKDSRIPETLWGLR